MEFLALEDGTIRDERYRISEIVEEPFQKVRKVYLQEPAVSTSKYNVTQENGQSSDVLSFTYSPREVKFEDFTVGETYNIVITLTNCTNRIASFRVLPISPKYRDEIHIEYVPPPKLSAGLSWKVKVIFTPVQNVDFETSITFRTEHGIFFVPVKVIKKRSILSYYPESLDFGVVVFGERVTKKLTLRNDGALPAKVFVSGSLRKWIEVLHKEPQSGRENPVISIKIPGYQLVVNPFSTCVIEVTFAPHQDVTIDDEIELKYESEEKVHIRKIPVKGSGGSLPVYLSSAREINFDWCFYGNTYCEKTIITNTTNVSVTVVPNIPSFLSSSLVFKPETACVQANDTFELYVLFTPQRGLDSVISSVIMLSVSGQVSPILMTLKAQLTERGFSLEQNKLDYGVSGPNEEIIIPLRVKNLSDLPQNIGFLKLPENVNIMPFRTFTMLPREIFDLEVGVRPPTLGQYTQVIKITNEYGDSRTVQLVGCGREYSMRFSKSCVSLPVCPINGETTCTTVLQNLSLSFRKFSLFSPNDALKVSPSTGVLSPGESIPIVIMFKAPDVLPVTLPVEEVVARPTPKLSGKKGKDRDVHNTLEKPPETVLPDIDALYKDWDSNSPDEIWSRHSTFFVKCVDGTETEKQIILLQVNCTVIKPLLVAGFLSRITPIISSKSEMSKRNLKKKVPVQNNVMDQTPVLEISPMSTSLVIEFGEIPLKQQAERGCLLRYTGENDIGLQVRPLDTLSPFRIVKLPNEQLSKNEECTMSIRFIPTEYGSYKDKIIISSIGANDISMSLLGVCRPADLFITKDRDITEDQIHSINHFVFDPVQLGQESRQQLFFHNLTSLPIEVNSKFVTSEGGEPQWPESHSFLIECDKFTIPGNCKMSTGIIFCPKVIGNMCLTLQIVAGAFKHNIVLEGRSCEKFVYFTFPGHNKPIEEDSIQYTGIQPNIFPSEGMSVFYPVQFNCVAEEVKTIRVGCVKYGTNFECIVNGWSETYLENGWRLDPMKATVTAGGYVTFTVTYRPKRDVGDVSFCAFSFVTKSSNPQSETTCHVRCTGTM
ncbi:uncharacterized protein TM35_000033990 [Trypanosoma theileri]|uniref:CFAP74 fourth Ig-like domain-containing protein n=1 Tax=Trypanosoma theileri TaxID=67003 RepID=A0A1X0P6T0_9TRYP|nr:uncharacterized protein TM35_000033990 [Trypanosoma theileri]ORC92646.1 hypothetical protein TM35_000033990 [Trypanosoma theileri]